MLIAAVYLFFKCELFIAKFAPLLRLILISGLTLLREEANVK